MKNSIVTFLILWICTIINAQEAFFPKLDSLKKTWSFIDVNGKPVLEIPYTTIQDIRLFSNDLVAAQDSKTKLWGYLNSEGKWQIKPAFTKANDFSGEFAIVSDSCKKNCFEFDENLLDLRGENEVSPFISSIINKKGQIIYTDKSQNQNIEKRITLEFNAGGGLFHVTVGTGQLAKQALINSKGKFICNPHYRNGDWVSYDDELKAYTCEKKFYNMKGELLFDYSEYTYIASFSNGYAWTTVSEEVDGKSIVWNILLDKNGQEKFRFDDNQYKSPSAVNDKNCFYFDKDLYHFASYNLTTKEEIPFQKHEMDIEGIAIFGDMLDNGCRYIYSPNNYALIGFINQDEVIFFKY